MTSSQTHSLCSHADDGGDFHERGKTTLHSTVIYDADLLVRRRLHDPASILNHIIIVAAVWDLS